MSHLRLTPQEYAAKMLGVHKRNHEILKKVVDDAFVHPKKQPKHTDWNERLAQQLALGGMTYASMEHTREHKFHPDRKWRIDFAWPHCKLAVEIDGAVHRIRKMWEKSFERDQALFFAGWRLLKFHPKQVQSGEALVLIDMAVKLLSED